MSFIPLGELSNTLCDHYLSSCTTFAHETLPDPTHHLHEHLSKYRLSRPPKQPILRAKINRLKFISSLLSFFLFYNVLGLIVFHYFVWLKCRFHVYPSLCSLIFTPPAYAFNVFLMYPPGFADFSVFLHFFQLFCECCRAGEMIYVHDT